MFSCKCMNLQAGYSDNDDNNNSNGIDMVVMHIKFKKDYQNFTYDDSFTNFFNRAHGPIPDLNINVVRHSALVYTLTLEEQDDMYWRFYLCINCQQVLFARYFDGETPRNAFYVNKDLRCSEQELKYRRNDKSYSETFQILIMDNDDAAHDAAIADAAPPASTSGVVNSSSSLSIGSLSAPMDSRLQRLRQLDVCHKASVQAEIIATNERVERYTHHQFALLKSYQEKNNQDLALLERRIKQVPEKTCQLLDEGQLVALEVTGLGVVGGGAGAAVAAQSTCVARRRNTISSRRELGMPITPTSPMTQPPNFLGLAQEQQQQQQQQSQPPLPSTTILSARKMSNFDTPPATPEATPMSVGNSPTFRQQQQQQQTQQQQASALANNRSLLTTPAAAADDADDCLFDLEDVDGPQGHTSHNYEQQQQQHYQRLQQQQHQHHQQQQQLLHQHEDNMSDADEAEDALGLDSSLPIAMRGAGTRGSSSAQMNFANFARSLPVEIANSPLAERANNNNNQQHVLLEDEEVLDNTVDIAASIKALARSVHGEAVFGDLPRPRLRSQI
ncbi:chromatin modification-related protein EAF1 [Drosophila hydei]|uniref:Chromatin modification-related protein EAF1 n=1 Tax=Drosophila hydei TaxID=7224 RepID=A0A6J1LMR6_DROHY|nr:chromatin modification-related protein EAF1 [Drosophila hydei]